MFSFALSEEERLVQETARRSARERLWPALRAHERARGVPDALAAEFAALGLDAIELPARLGGQGLGAFARALVLEELAAADPGATLALDGTGFALALLAEAELDALVLALRAPGRRAAVIENTGSFGLTDGRLSGSHPWVASDRLDLALVLGDERALAIREGFELTPASPCGLEAAGASRLVLRHAPVAATIESAATIARGRARIRTAIGALLVGAARGAYEYAVRYAGERTAFGRPIAHHQGLAFLIADLATAIDVARLSVWRAAATIDRGEDAAWAAASALAEAAEQALLVGPSAVQILGGHGFMKDHPVEKWMRDIRTLAQLAGGREAAELDTVTLAPAIDLGFA